jgi:hypothetical protein
MADAPHPPLGRLEAVGAAALVLAAGLLPLQGVRWRGGTWWTVNDVVDKAVGLGPADPILVLAAAVGGLLLVGRRRFPLRIPRALVVGELLLLTGGVLGLASAEHSESAQLFGRMIAVILLCQVAVWGVAPRGRWLGAVGVSYVAGAAVSVLFGVVALVATGDESRFTSGGGRAVGLAGNATAFAVMTAVALAIAIVAAVDGDGRRARQVWGAVTVVLGAGLAASGARGIVLTTLLVVALVAWRAWRAGRPSVALATAAFVGGLLFLGMVGVLEVPVVDRLVGRSGSEAGETAATSADVRFDQLGEEVDRRGAHSLLVGSGLRDEEPSDADVDAGRLRDPHTAHLEVWLGLGLLGFVGWGLVWWSAIAPGAGLLAARRRVPPLLVPVACAAAASTTFVLAALTANNLWNRYVWLLVAFSVLLAGRSDTTAKATRGASRPSVGTWWRNSEWTSTVAAQPDSTRAEASTT